MVFSTDKQTLKEILYDNNEKEQLKHCMFKPTPSFICSFFRNYYYRYVFLPT